MYETDPHDFRFDIRAMEEPEMGCTHLVRVIELAPTPADERWPVETVVDGELLESFTTDDPYGAVEAAREAQAYTLEERLEMAAEREGEERLRGR